MTKKFFINKYNVIMKEIFGLQSFYVESREQTVNNLTNGLLYTTLVKSSVAIMMKYADKVSHI